MSERDEEEEGRKKGIRVVDRRRFTAEGDVRTDVEEAPEPAPRIVTPGGASAPEAATGNGRGVSSSPSQGDTIGAGHSEGPRAGPDAGSSAGGGGIDFLSFIASLATNAMGALGALPEGYGRGLPQDPALAREYIDILGMLQDKTRGNLTPAEAQAFERLLADVRMAYVERTKGQSGG